MGAAANKSLCGLSACITARILNHSANSSTTLQVVHNHATGRPVSISGFHSITVIPTHEDPAPTTRIHHCTTPAPPPPVTFDVRGGFLSFRKIDGALLVVTALTRSPFLLTDERFDVPVRVRITVRSTAIANRRRCVARITASDHAAVVHSEVADRTGEVKRLPLDLRKLFPPVSSGEDGIVPGREEVVRRGGTGVSVE